MSAIVMLCLLSSHHSIAAITITAATGGTNICYTKAANGSGPAQTTLGSIVISEGGASDFGTSGSGTLTIAPPAGWQFNTSTLPTVTGGGSGITVTRAWSSGNLVVTRTMTILSALATNTITIAGLEVQATTTLSSSGSIANSAQTGTWTGLSTGSSLGNLSLQGPPSAIAGASRVCVNATTVLTDPSGTSTWTSSNTSIATIGATTGTVTGIAAGTVNITFAPSCGFITRVMTVDALPAVSGIGAVCEGSITLLSGSPAGTWGSGNTSVATVSAIGEVAGVSANTAIITFTATSTTCKRNTTVTVNPLPAAITGTASACLGGTTTLDNATGTGTWSSGDESVATADPASGVVTGISAGNAFITFTLPTTCMISQEVTINPLPVISIFPSSSATICDGESTSFTASIAGPASAYVWSGADGLMCTACAATTITPSAVGPNNYSVTVTDANGCSDVSGVVVNVNPLPEAITGTFEVCVNSVMTLENTMAGGTWSSSNSSIAPVDESSGVVSGAAMGNATITYTSVSGCIVVADVTVNPLPLPILGAGEVCSGATVTMGDLSGGGDWSSNVPGVAAVDAAGVISGGIAGAATISYTFASTGCYVTSLVTVHPQPGAIGGVSELCEGELTTLTNADAGGTWSDDASDIAGIAPHSGVLLAIDAGTTNVTYTLPGGCYSSTNFRVNAMPSAIGDVLEVCKGLTVSLNNGMPGGTWAATTPSIADIDGDGVVTGFDAGMCVMSYTLPGGCFVTATVTVNPTPATIDGAFQVCEGLTTTLSNIDPDGTWESSAYGTALIDANGIVNALSAGGCTITYQLPTGCINTADVTVNPLPADIVGASQVCAGLTTMLANSTAGGGWSASDPDVATIAASGEVSGHDAGNTTITYTLTATGCLKTWDMTVNPLPAAITGVAEVCEASVTGLEDITPGGTWISGNIATAEIDGAGVVSGIVAGVAPITYKLPTGCQAVVDVTVNPLPAVIMGTKVVCELMTTTLNNATADGTWTSTGAGVATVDLASGEVTGVSEGSATIWYTLPTGCKVNSDVTVNPVPDPITGEQQVCAGLATTLSSTTSGGTWSSGVPGVASANATSGTVTGVTMGNAIITYTLPTSCRTMTTITVNPLPAPITGPSQMCAADVSAFADGSAGGTWTSSAPLVASIDNATGDIIANSSGATLITYTLATGCLRVRTLTVNALPGAITGSMEICQSRTTTLSNDAGGFWDSFAPIVATVNGGGVVTGVSAGTAQVVYRLPTGCAATAIVTVDVMPSILTSGAVVCQGQTVTLPTSISGGSWLSGAATVASVDAAGAMTGMGTGSAYISYIMPTGCTASIPVAVNEMPVAISGASSVCQGSTMVLTNASSAGVWTSSVTGVASINFTTGVVTGLAAGTANISYTMPSGGCFVTHTITVNPMPAAFTGSPVVCNGQTTTLSSSTTGGTWSSNNPSVAAITSGVVSGISAGTSNVSYELASGCMRSITVIVNALPEVYNVTGGGTYCPGGAGVHIGLDNSNGGAAYQLYSGTTPVGGAVTGVSGLPVDFGMIGAGSYSVVATSAINGCSNNMTSTATVLVASSVPAYVDFSTASGSDTVCSGAPVAFTATATNGGTTPVYEWQVNGVAVSGAGSNVYTYTPSNGDVVTVNMESSVMCATPAIAVATRTITVKTSVMPVAGISVTPGSTSCQGEQVTFSASALYGGSAPVFMWMKNGALATTGAIYSYTPVNGDVVYVKLVSNQGCRLADQVSSSNVEMTVNPVYNPTVTITADPGVTVQVGTSVTLTANVTNGGPSPAYQWYIGMFAIAGATDATFTNNTFSSGDSVSFIVTGTGGCGTAGHSSVVMHIGGVGIAMPTAYGDIRLVPNPNKGEFSVKGTLPVADDKEVAIEVTNMLGQVVYRSSVKARNGNIDAQVKLDNTLANGMYMLNIVSGENRSVFHFVLEQ